MEEEVYENFLKTFDCIQPGTYDFPEVNHTLGIV